MTKLLLLESLHADPLLWSKTDDFPFLQGLANDVGVPVLWLALAAQAAEQPAEALRAELTQALRTFAPTVILANEAPGAALHALLAEAAPQAHVLSMPDEGAGPGASLSRAAVLSFFEQPLPFAAGTFLGAARPDYSCRMLQADDVAARGLASIVVENACPYAKPIAGNPFFEGVDLSGALRTTGCSFCQGMDAPTQHVGRVEALDLALLQIQRHAQTAPPERRTGRFHLMGRDLFALSADLLRRVLAEDLSPSAFYFSCRVDEFLARAASIEALLPDLAARGHSLHIWQMGLENFSTTENERFNKGIRGAQIIKAFDLLRRFEQAWPRTFVFTEHGNFALILFTPWTTLADLQENIAGLRRIGCPPDSLMITNRLQLLPRAPITLLAERDGLVGNAFSDLTFLPFPCVRTGDGASSELPWRFLHGAVDAVYRLLIRTRPSDLVPPGDALLAQVRHALQGLPPQRATRLSLLDSLVEAAGTLPEPVTPETLLAALQRHLEADPALQAWRQAAALVRRAAQLVQKTMTLDPPPFSGFSAQNVKLLVNQAGAPEAAVDLVRGGERLALWLVAAQAAQPTLARIGALGIGHRSETPCDTPAKRQALEAFLQFLRQHAQRIGATP